MSKPDGGPAYPCPSGHQQGFGRDTPGMTLRQFYAAHAPSPPAWWLSYGHEWAGTIKDDELWFAWRWHYADMMIAHEAGESE